MIRLAKLTDYGIALMTHMARAAATSVSARELAEATQIPLPTVSKLLKSLGVAGLLHSQRGVHGGYSLTRAPSVITVADVVEALEGSIALTDCGTGAAPMPAHECSVEHVCRVKPHWQKINGVVRRALTQLTLADMAADALPVIAPSTLFSIQRKGLPVTKESA